MKYKVTNRKLITVYVLQHEIPSGESYLDLTDHEARVVESTNDLILEPMRTVGAKSKKKNENKTMIKKRGKKK